MTAATAILLAVPTAIPGAGVTWNPADKAANCVLSSGNTKWTSGGATATSGCRATTSHSTGQWYLEFVITVDATGYPRLGLGDASASLAILPGSAGSGTAFACSCATTGGDVWSKGSYQNTYSTFTSGDKLMVAIDFAASKIWMGKNGTWFNTGNPAAGTGPVITNATGNPALFPIANGATIAAAIIKPALADFTYSVPSGFSPWG